MKRLILGILLNLVLITGIDSKVTGHIAAPKEKVATVWYHPITMEDEILYRLVTNGVDSLHAKFIVCQGIFESGWYKNNLSKRHNNIFARHHSKYDRQSLGAGGTAEGHSKFARYPSIPAAVESQVEYFQRKKYSFSWTSIEQFAKELKQKGYYEAPESHYARGLRKIYNELYGENNIKFNTMELPTAKINPTYLSSAVDELDNVLKQHGVRSNDPVGLKKELINILITKVYHDESPETITKLREQAAILCEKTVAPTYRKE